MSEGDSLLTKRGFALVRRTVVAAMLLAFFVAGFWIINQSLDAVAILNRGTVDLPFYPVSVDVWYYHDVGSALLWVAYVGFVFWEITPWKPGSLTSSRVIIALLGFAILTAGLWLVNDLLTAAQSLHRNYVDFPFFVEKLDLWETRDVITLLTSGGFVAFYALIRVAV